MANGRVPLKIKVHPVVREFLVSLTGSDVIDPIQNSTFYHRIKFILQLNPKNYNQTYLNRRFKNESTITILVGWFQMCDKRIDPLSRNYLDDARQYLISKELYQSFKNIFHNYMLAYMRGGGVSQKKGIEDFCCVYNLALDNITYEMLKKSWDRSEEKKMFKNLLATSSLKNITI
jgi:hypothetical protein